MQLKSDKRIITVGDVKARRLQLNPRARNRNPNCRIVIPPALTEFELLTIQRIQDCITARQKRVK